MYNITPEQPKTELLVSAGYSFAEWSGVKTLHKPTVIECDCPNQQKHFRSIMELFSRKGLRCNNHRKCLPDWQKQCTFAICNENKNILIHNYETIKQTFRAKERDARKGNPIW